MPSPPTPLLSPHFDPLPILCVFFENSTEFSWCCQYVLVYKDIYWRVGGLLEDTSLEKTGSPCPNNRQ